MKYQGIVIRIVKSKAVVTTDDFQCFYIKRSPTLYVGKEIEFTEKEIIRKRPVLKTLMLSAACIFILFIITSVSELAGVFNITSEPKVFAYVGVDINPSLEIEIDEIGNVLRLVPINEDAKVLVKELKYDKISVCEAVDNIIDELKKNNVVTEVEKDYILISSTLNNKKSEFDKEYQVEKEKLDNIMNSLKDDIQEKENGKVNIYLVETNINERKEAQTVGISTGRYILYNKNEDLRNSLSIEEAKNVNVVALVKDVLTYEQEKHNLAQNTPVPTPSPLKTEDTKMNESATPSIKPDDLKINAQIPSKTLLPLPLSTSTPKPTQTSKPTLTSKPMPTSNPTPTNIITSMFRRFESYNYRGQFIRHESFKARLSQNITKMDDSVFKVVPGLADPNCISFESKNFPGYYLKHENFKVILKKDDGSATYKKDVTYKKVPGLADNNLVSFQSYNFPNRYIRHRDYFLCVEEINTDLDKKDATYIEVKFE